MLAENLRSEHIFKEQDNIIRESNEGKVIYERLYSMRDMKKEMIEEKQKEKELEEERKIQSLTFAPNRVSIATKGMRDKRKMFTDPKGIEEQVKRMHVGRLQKE